MLNILHDLPQEISLSSNCEFLEKKKLYDSSYLLKCIENKENLRFISP